MLYKYACCNVKSVWFVRKNMEFVLRNICLTVSGVGFLYFCLFSETWSYFIKYKQIFWTWIVLTDSASTLLYTGREKISGVHPAQGLPLHIHSHQLQLLLYQGIHSHLLQLLYFIRHSLPPATTPTLSRFSLSPVTTPTLSRY